MCDPSADCEQFEESDFKVSGSADMPTIEDIMDVEDFRAEQQSALTNDTIYRLIVEASRLWLINHYLRTGKLPEENTYFIYPNGEISLDWGNPSGRDDGKKIRVLCGKRVCVTLSVENW